MGFLKYLKMAVNIISVFLQILQAVKSVLEKEDVQTT